MSLFSLLLTAEFPVIDYPFVPSDVALYHRTAHGADTGLVDPQTWDDMLLQPYSAQLAQETSIFGQQELYRRLQAPADAYSVDASAVRVRALVADAGQRQLLHQTCASLRRADREVGEHLFGAAAPARPRWTPLLRWLPVAFLLSAVLALVSGWLPLWGVVLALWVALMGVQLRFRDEADEWVRINHAIQQMLRTHSLLARLDAPLAAPFREDAARAGKINRAIGPSLMRQLPGGREYADWLWLLNIRHYFDSRETVRLNAEALRHSFRLVAALEADLALARHLAQAPRYCGIGKSTLLRTVGLNLILARAFGFCYADSAVTPGLPVYSSMQSEDALDGGESLYIAELRRARELLALAPGVLKETNGISLLATRGFEEAISAKASRVFDWLSDYMTHPADYATIRNCLNGGEKISGR